MFDTHAIIKKVFKDFFLGTGVKPSLDEYNKALSEINKDHADGPSVIMDLCTISWFALSLGLI